MKTLDRKGAVAIAKDMLAQLDARAVQMERGIYFDGYASVPTGTHQLGTLPIKDCVCCQLGALLLSKARVFNDVAVTVHESGNISFGGSRRTRANMELASYFSQSEIDEMERDFEHSEDDETAEQSARRIAQNIIDKWENEP